MDIKKFKKLPIMGIIRGIELEYIERLIAAVISSGLKTIEITMNTEGADRLIKKAIRFSKGRLVIGAGTVLNLDSLKLALDCGASFIVMPVLIEQVVKYCVKHKIPVFPGALTPQEIYRAWESGATMVKVFPAKFFGPQYFKEIKGPFNQLELLACAGVTAKNMKEYFACGASAVAFGAGVFRKDWIANNNFANIAASIKEFVDEYEGG